MRTPTSFALFLVVSIAFHVWVGGKVPPPPTGPASAGPPAALVAQGNSFADLVEGTANPAPAEIEPVEDVVPPEIAPESAPPTMIAPSPTPIEQPRTPETTNPSPPAQVSAPSGGLRLRAEEISQTSAEILASSTPTAPLSAAPAATSAYVSPTATPMTPPATRAEREPETLAEPEAEALAEPEPATPSEPAPLQPVNVTLRPVPAPGAEIFDSREVAEAEPQRIDAQPEVLVNEITDALARPPARPADLGKPPPRQQVRPTTPRRQNTARGNSNDNAQRGSVSGNRQSSETARAGQGGQTQDAIAARVNQQAAANYAGIVMRKISRTRRKRARSRGVANVGFSVAASGGLVSVRLIGSSGDPGLDQIALDHIRRSAPFPPPPPGAQRSFSIEFRGR